MIYIIVEKYGSYPSVKEIKEKKCKNFNLFLNNNNV